MASGKPEEAIAVGTPPEEMAEEKSQQVVDKAEEKGQLVAAGKAAEEKSHLLVSHLVSELAQCLFGCSFAVKTLRLLTPATESHVSIVCVCYFVIKEARSLMPTQIKQHPR